MPLSYFDHLVCTAPSLGVGANFIRTALGCELEKGGEHERMATHNLVLRLGESSYLEVIAPNPQAPAPSRPRWFELDRAQADTPPRLSTWVLRTNDIEAVAQGATEWLGAIEAMQRPGLEWLITLPEDGALVLAGAAPALIEWRHGAHPATCLLDQGLSLVQLEIIHPEAERLRRLLISLEVHSPVLVRSDGAHTTQLIAQIRTPNGLRSVSIG